MTTQDVGTADDLILAQKCMHHAITFQFSIGLLSTDDPLMSQKVANFECSKFYQKENLFPADQYFFERLEYHNPWEGICSVKNLILFENYNT